MRAWPIISTRTRRILVSNGTLPHHAVEEFILVELQVVAAATTQLRPAHRPEPSKALMRRVVQLLPPILIRVELARATVPACGTAAIS